MRFLHPIHKIGREEKIGQIRRGVESASDVAEELRADDAAGAPDFRDNPHWQVPAIFLRGGAHNRKALSVCGDLAGEERQFQFAEEFCVGFQVSLARAIGLFSVEALRLHRGERSGRNRGLNAGGGHAQHLSFDH